jgi:predicted nuclease of predicted toxin-antitoxin system
MGTLSSELAGVAGRVSGHPRVYVDANVPAGLVAFMRDALQWDVLFVLEDDRLRRAPDVEHYRMARQLGRTLITLDRDYLDDERFPLASSGGVLVLTAPELRGFKGLLTRLDREVLAHEPLPLTGQKLHVHVDWNGDAPSR